MAGRTALFGLLLSWPQAGGSASFAAAPPPQSATAAVPQGAPSVPVASPRAATTGPQSIRIGSSSLFARPRVSVPAQRRGNPGSAATYVAPTAPPAAVPPPPGAKLAPASAPFAGGANSSRLPSVVLQALDRGPISEREAALLVELLLSSGTSAALSGAASGGTPRLLDQPVDPDLLQVAELLDGEPAASANAPLDPDRLRTWFARLDLSHDAAVSFLEWRDVTAAPLDLFRDLDESRDGLLRFDEFARAILLNTAREGTRPVDPQLFDWARASLRATEPLAPIDLAELEGLSDAEVLARARAAIAAEAARKALAAPPAVAPAKGGAKGG